MTKTFKKASLLCTLLLAAFFITSCSSDDDNGNGNGNNDTTHAIEYKVNINSSSSAIVNLKYKAATGAMIDVFSDSFINEPTTQWSKTIEVEGTVDTKLELGLEPVNGLVGYSMEIFVDGELKKSASSDNINDFVVRELSYSE